MNHQSNSVTVATAGFENYTVTSEDYDSCRVPYGVEVILGALCFSSKQPLKNLHLLDAGCGTGNFTVALSSFVGKVTGVELNEGMRKKVLEKTAHLRNVSIKKGSVVDMHFLDSETFDGVMINQVIHHLDEPGTTSYPNAMKFMSEAYRLLKPGGVLLLNTCSPEQIMACLWFTAIVPSAQKQIAMRFIPIPKLQSLMEEAGFASVTVTVLPQLTRKANVWQNERAPLSQELRNSDSTYALATIEELARHLSIWEKKIEDHSSKEFIAEHEKNRLRLGSTTTLIAYKSI